MHFLSAMVQLFVVGTLVRFFAAIAGGDAGGCTEPDGCKLL
jgi:hypothetical protein